MESNSESIRLQKRIADSGYCSRRRAEVLIESGKVEVNGKIVTKLGSKVSPSDDVTVDGKSLAKKQEVTIALHKPAGYITSKSDPYHSQTIMDLLPADLQHLKPAGRLDKDSEGLVILSTDGALIQELSHPRHQHKKVYEIIVKGYPKAEQLEPLTSGKLKLDDKVLQPMKFKILKTTKDRKTWIQMELKEGRNRQIRRVMDSLGFPVLYLRRTKIGRFSLADLEKGQYKIL